jgi:hypothetical protein
MASLRVGLGAWAGSRAVCWLAALAASQIATNRDPGVPSGAPDWLAAVALRWDALHFADVARDGYPSGAGGDWAFFPGFPAVARAFGGSGGGLWWSGTGFALVCSAAAFVLLHRLALVEGLDPAAARRGVWLLGLFPGAFALGAFYSEAPFLLFTVAAVLLARTDRWAAAGLCAGAATLTRTSGVLIVVPLVLIAWRARPPLHRAAWLAAGPAALLAWMTYAAARADDALAFSHAQTVWGRGFHGPLAAVWLGAGDAASALGDLFEPAAAGQFEPPWMKVGLLAILVFAVVGTVGAWRRFGAPAGLYCALSLALPLSAPWPDHPLMSLPRFVVVLFPLFLWLGTKRRAFWPMALVFGSGLAVLAGRYAVWAWAA